MLKGKLVIFGLAIVTLISFSVRANGGYNLAQANEYCGANGRLPTAREMAEMFEDHGAETSSPGSWHLFGEYELVEAKNGTYIDRFEYNNDDYKAPPQYKGKWFWTSSHYASNDGFAIAFDGSRGSFNYNDVSVTHSVLCVAK